MNKTIAALAAIFLTAGVLTACGGGSVSTGAGGARSADNLVVKVNSNGSAFFQTGPEQGNRMLAAVADFLVEEATAAAPEGHTVTVYDSTNVAVGQDVTDVNGEATFLLPPGSYTVCIDEATPTTGTGCVTVTIADNSLVTATVTCDASLACALSEVTEEDVTSIQDPDKPHKVIICHIPPGNPDNQRTLSVGQESLQDHLDHGDTAGPCPEETAEGVEGEEDDDRGPPANAGRPDNPGNGNGPPGNGNDDNEDA